MTLIGRSGHLSHPGEEEKIFKATNPPYRESGEDLAN